MVLARRIGNGGVLRNAQLGARGALSSGTTLWNFYGHFKTAGNNFRDPFDIARDRIRSSTLDAEASGIAALAAALEADLGAPFTAAVDLIRNAKGRLIVTGLGKSGHIGKKMAATFASTGTPAFFVHAAEASHGDLGMITADDVIMALSWSGETAELKNLITYSRRFRIGLIAVTSDAASTLGAAADIALTLPKAREALPAQSGADHVVADAARAR